MSYNLMAESAAMVLFLMLLSISSPVKSSSPICRPDSLLLNRLQSSCPLFAPQRPPAPPPATVPIPLRVDGDFLDNALTGLVDGYVAILFYASWCPFSQNIPSTFEILNSMFPQIKHLAIEQSETMPSVFSRYGIHSLPSVIMVNQTSRVRYQGRKTLPFLVQFYKRTTGFEPVQWFSDDHLNSLASGPKSVARSWNGSSLREIVTREIYLAFSVAFLCIRVLMCIFPQVLSCLRAFWISYVPHLNLEIFGDTSQIFGRDLHVINLKRFWTKFRLCKTRNFHEGAKSARVWASSLASVSVGEPSSGRSLS